jgi:glycosyltransferase involved in cell wall biosynthesis
MSASTFQPWVVIPVYNHEAAITAMVDGVRAHGLHCLLVDDGSHAACAGVLRALAQQECVQLLRLEVNQGKGGAMLAGFRAAAQGGASHVLQIDADGQHATADIPKFLAMAEANPGSVINGAPVYDASVPKGRLYGRYLTHVWVWINTLSFDIRDSMCGFRVYPLADVLGLIERERVGQRMDFDPDILVRLHWRGVPVLTLPTPVRYPTDGISHFDLWRDNVRISRMHTRLFFGMLRRLPRLLGRKLQ